MSGSDKPVVVGDVHRIRQVIVNLLNNAIKFTIKGTVELKMNVTAMPEGFSDIVIEIVDTGIGIAKDKLETVFDKFIQAEISDTRIFGGTGLGLTISKSIIELMNGTLTVKSEVGKGTTFTITLSLRTTTTTATTTTTTTTTTTNDMIVRDSYVGKVLVVEDNLINQKVMKKTFDKFGIDFTISENGL